MAIETDSIFPAEENPEAAPHPSADERLFAGGITLLAVEAFAHDNGFNPVISSVVAVVLGAVVAKSIR